MKNTNNTNKEIEKFRLLMMYDTKKTLSENKELFKNNSYLLKEGVGAEVADIVLSNLAKKGGPELKSSVEAATRKLGGVHIHGRDGISYFSKDADEIIKAMEKGTIAGIAEAGKLAKQLFQKGASLEIRTAAADAIVGMKSFKIKYGKPGMTREQMIQELMEGPKYTKEEAEMLIERFNKIKVEKPPVKIETEPVKPEPKPEPKPDPLKPTEPKKWTEKTWDWIKRNWKKLALGAGALWLLWYWFKDEEIFPTCLLNLMSEKDLEKSSLGDGEIYVSKLNISNLDTYGGGKFYTNGNFETITGRIKGTWKKEGETFLIVVGSQNYTFECKDTTPPVPPVPPPVPPKPEDNKCKTLPMKAGCIDDSGEGIINKIQECLGVAVTGKLDSATIQKLKEKYGVEILDQSTYDKIIKDCYETIDDRKFTEI